MKWTIHTFFVGVSGPGGFTVQCLLLHSLPWPLRPSRGIGSDTESDTVTPIHVPTTPTEQKRRVLTHIRNKTTHSL
ncbi:hypothetical protein BD410DRAFT_793212 [Rickenella mellea]|uniref:Uncharacterized protein n=1 Tax=Rickenella mellea TaxID=50990 RepID=A0A4Y7PTM3_9AGAM|nr:hypothetical protein BD410DRAFT_793212 [Rickenella mellea]